MNIFEFGSFAIALIVLYFLAKVLSPLVGLNLWVVFGSLTAFSIGVFIYLGAKRDRRLQDQRKDEGRP